jgi:hypothetical protein
MSSFTPATTSKNKETKKRRKHSSEEDESDSTDGSSVSSSSEGGTSSSSEEEEDRAERRKAKKGKGKKEDLKKKAQKLKEQKRNLKRHRGQTQKSKSNEDRILVETIIPAFPPPPPPPTPSTSMPVINADWQQQWSEATIPVVNVVEAESVGPGKPTFISAVNVLQLYGESNYKKVRMTVGASTFEMCEVQWKGQNAYDALVFKKTSVDAKGKTKEWHYSLPMSAFPQLWQFMHVVNNGQHQCH